MSPASMYGTPIPGFDYDICILPIAFEPRLGIFFFRSSHDTMV